MKSKNEKTPKCKKIKNIRQSRPKDHQSWKHQTGTTQTDDKKSRKPTHPREKFRLPDNNYRFSNDKAEIAAATIPQVAL